MQRLVDGAVVVVAVIVNSLRLERAKKSVHGTSLVGPRAVDADVMT
jgi:hypothetical protein